MAWVASPENKSSSQSPAIPRIASPDRAEAESRAFLARVYRWMSLGLGLTGVVALLVASSPGALMFILGNRGVFLGLIVAELLMVMAFAPVAARASAATAALMFFGYSALNGLTLSVIFVLYTASSIGTTFFITAGTFAGLSAYGAVTRRDLSSIGSFCIMGLWGVILASIVNVFMGSPAIYWFTTFAGVLVFTGLTIYDTQKIKALNVIGNEGTEEDTKEALHGALVLYLDFINLFLMLLRIFGGRRN